MKYIGAIDQGTTSTRFMIFDQAGKVVAAAQRPHAQIFPQPGWVEHDPVELLENTRLVMAEAVIRAGLYATDIAAIGITNQRETTIAWNPLNGQPYYNAIVWQDMRCQDLAGRFSAQYGSEGFAGITGLPLSPYFSALKMVWLLENVPGLPAALAAGELVFGTVDSWLLYHLTGELKTDVTNASRTLLLDLHSLEWSVPLLEAFSIPDTALPQVFASAGWLGTIREGAFKNIPVMACLGDQQAALIGQTCFEPGEVKNTYGTGCFMLMNTGESCVFSRHGLLTTVAYKFGQEPCRYALEGSIAVAGSLVQWLRDNLNLIGSSDEIEALAASVPDNGNVYLVPAFSGLYAPYWRSDARGIISGLTRFATRAHIARAALEATAYQTLDVLQAMEKDSGISLAALNADGGMVINGLLMQFQADILQVPVQVPGITETTALGAAYAAGLASGYFTDISQLKQQHHIRRSWRPAMDPAVRDRYYQQWKQAVLKSFGDTAPTV